MKKILYTILTLLLLNPLFVFGAITFPVNGGTGSSTLSGIILGNGTSPVNTLTIGSGLTLSGTTLSASGGSGSIYPFTTVLHWGQTTSGTSTPLWLQGSPFSLFASSTSAFDSATTTNLEAKSNLWLTYLSIGSLAVDGNGRVYSAASTTAGTGLTYTGNAFNINTTQAISKLSNLTTNGFVKTSGGDGTLGIDTSTYLTSAITAIGPLGQTQTGPTQTLATTSSTQNGVTHAITIVGSSNTQTFTPSDNGTLNEGGGGTNQTTYAKGDTIYASAANTLSKLTVGTGGFVLASANGIPTWVATTTFSSPLTYSNGAVTCSTCLTANQNITLSGDVTGSGATSITATLATVNANTGSFGSSTAIPNFTVNGKGLITAAGTNAVIAPAGTLSGTTLNSTVVTSSLTSVGTITSGTWNGGIIPILYGGTNATTYPTNSIIGFDGTRMIATGTVTTLTVPTITATTTATSTFSGPITIATTSPQAFLITDKFNTPVVQVQTASTTGLMLNVQASTTPFATYFGIGQDGHRITGGVAPSCGTGCSSVVGDDNNMRMITGSTITTATINFGTAWRTTSNTLITPVCDSNEESAGSVSADASSTPTTVVLTFASALTTKTIAIHCEASNNFTY